MEKYERKIRKKASDVAELTKVKNIISKKSKNGDFENLKRFEMKQILCLVAKQLQNSGNTHVIMIDEMTFETGPTDLNLSYLSQFTKVHFLIIVSSLRVTWNVNVIFVNLRKNQTSHIFLIRHRNTYEIKRFLDHVQENQVDGHAYSEDAENTEALPPAILGLLCTTQWFHMPTYALWNMEDLEKRFATDCNPIAAIIKRFRTVISDLRVPILYDGEKSLRIGQYLKLKDENDCMEGPYYHIEKAGCEADVVIFITETSLPLQTLSLARQCLILVTHGNFPEQSVRVREDGTIETAVPLPAPFAGGSSGATPFTPGHFIDAMPPE